MGVSQTLDDLYAHLKDQIIFLQNSCKSYDEGFKGEAKRLAVVIRVLVHDTNRSKSLLTQLNCKNTIFYDTAYDYNPKNLISHMGLIGIKMGPKGVEYWAPLDDGPPGRPRVWVPFDLWWNKIVFKNDSYEFSRKDVILAVANKDGGAHVDPTLHEAYAKLSRNNLLGWMYVENGVERGPILNPELAAIRQIAYEVIKTLQRKFPNYF
ncbi:hypothetical protein E308F_25340 [Moorella sp. E308F]|uniref:hypothetical protein n=1 Tax=Moorella sp. E308F TaxID=2572682 RepID=UPI0010FFBA6A|nr:hypothetical protein [Moorella sp. E308F]GEA16290.1 hypothetical protein E308F_25340 [Moorella sp. E308F]